MDSARNTDEFIKEKAKAMVDVTHSPDCVRVTVGPGWRDGIVSPETICCFRLSRAIVGKGRPWERGRVHGPWIGWN
jgi:hypothetical protein